MLPYLMYLYLQGKGCIHLSEENVLETRQQGWTIELKPTFVSDPPALKNIKYMSAYERRTNIPLV